MFDHRAAAGEVRGVLGRLAAEGVVQLVGDAREGRLGDGRVDDADHEAAEHDRPGAVAGVLGIRGKLRERVEVGVRVQTVLHEFAHGGGKAFAARAFQPLREGLAAFLAQLIGAEGQDREAVPRDHVGGPEIAAGRPLAAIGHP